MANKKSDLKIVSKKISELQEADYNPRKLTEKEYDDIKNSLEEFGFVDPIIVNTHKDRKNTIVGGHQRVRIAKDLGFKEVPCVEVNLDIEKEKELNVRLNRNTGSWDYDKLSTFFEDADKLMDWGFEEWEISKMDATLDVEEEDEDEDEAEEKPSPTDDEYSNLTFTLIHENKLKIVEILNDVKAKHQLEKIEDALMEVFISYEKNEM